jgi:tellurite resistance protein
MVDVVATPARAGTSYVEWGAVFAGALAASAISFVLLTAGAAIGLSLISPYAGESYSKTAASVAVFWSVAVPILSFLIGGYIAGRMRSAWETATSDEVQFRDGMHGMLVWALSIVAGGLLAFFAAGTLANSSAHVAAGALGNRDAVVAPAIDTLFGASVAQTAAAPAATPTKAAPAATPAPSAVPGTGERAVVPDSEARAVIARTLAAAAAAGELTPSQKRSLAQIVSERTGLSQADAEKRVDQAYKDAVAAIETARKAAVLTGLATATALLVGLLAAWFAAQNGGRHRDENIPARFALTFAPPTRRTPLR